MKRGLHHIMSCHTSLHSIIQKRKKEKKNKFNWRGIELKFNCYYITLDNTSYMRVVTPLYIPAIHHPIHKMEIKINKNIRKRKSVTDVKRVNTQAEFKLHHHSISFIHLIATYMPCIPFTPCSRLHVFSPLSHTFLHHFTHSHSPSKIHHTNPIPPQFTPI